MVRKGDVKIAVIIQARMGSTRLPGKAMLELCGKSVLTRVIERVKGANAATDICVATTTCPEDEVVVKEAEKNNVKVYRGSEDDVLDRYCKAADMMEADYIVRIPADNPLTEPRFIDMCVEEVISNGLDYAIMKEKNVPYGSNVEVVSRDTLLSIYERSTAEEKEHVTAFIRNNPEKFRVSFVEPPEALRHTNIRLTMDTPDDYKWLKRIFEHFKNSPTEEIKLEYVIESGLALRMKIGLKLWSNNENYLSHAENLWGEGVFDFIELYLVPGTYEKYVSQWKGLEVPYFIHAPHAHHKFNLADSSREEDNLKLYDETRRLADELNASLIIVHPGVLGEDTDIPQKQKSIKKQLKMLNDERVLIENKPYKAINDLGICAGSSPEEIRDYIEATGMGFCLDVNHALKYAISMGRDHMEAIKEFADMGPKIIHICGLDDTVEEDKHLHLYDSEIDLDNIMNILTGCGTEYWTIETPKDSKTDLEDFKKEVFFLKGAIE